jgi:ribosome recycling factor
MEGHIDDIKAFLPESDLEKVQAFEKNFSDILQKNIIDMYYLAQLHTTKDRKTFALSDSAKIMESKKRSVIFSVFDNPSLENISETLIEMVKNHLTKNVRYDEIKAVFLNGLNYNV